MSTKINWTTSTGIKIEITVGSNYELDRQGVRKTDGRKEIVITAAIDGKDHFAPGGLCTITRVPGIVAAIGSIGLTPENNANVEAAIAAEYALIADHNAALDRHENELAALGNGCINDLLRRNGCAAAAE